MNKLKPALLLFILFIWCKTSAQYFVLQETNLDKKKNAQFFSTVTRCESVLQKQLPVNSLQFSGKAKLTNTYINTTLAERFTRNLSQFKPATGTAGSINRTLASGNDKIIKTTYGLIGADKNTTTDYIQIVVIFDGASASPKIDDIQIRSKSDNGILTLSPRELLALRKPATPPPVKKK
ncbi:hypothetical protein WSM22_21470 [Cytophagales bacterium WSM2-2]|nr:hypothetical protein WSM22_21470 [Cytophagales bacterium WSM2-2]